MSYVLAFLRWVFGIFVDRTKEAAIAEERERVNQTNAARLERQNEVANKPVTNDELRKALRDGGF